MWTELRIQNQILVNFLLKLVKDKKIRHSGKKLQLYLFLNQDEFYISITIFNTVIIK